MKRKIISVFLAILLIMTVTVPTFATSAQEKKEQLESELNDAKDEKEEVTSQKNQVLDEISELDAQIAQYESEIKKLNAKIEDLETSIEKKEKEIKKLEKESEEKQEILVERLVAMYEAGQTTYLDVLLSSDSIVSFLSNYYMVEQLAEADQSVIDAINQKQQEIEQTKKELENEKSEIATSKKEVETKSNKVAVAKASKETKVASLSAEEKKLQAKIDEFNAAIKEAEEEIRREAEQAQSSGGGYKGSFEGDLSWPLSSSSPYYNYITSIFGHRDQPTAGASTNHGAIDIAVSYAPVYAPASGKVIIARYLSGYGNYVLIDHGNGYYTGFGHLSSFKVSKGDTVSRGQPIAVSGDTGISTGPHLHYEVHIGGYDQSDRVDPLQYTSHPALEYAPWI